MKKLVLALSLALIAVSVMAFVVVGKKVEVSGLLGSVNIPSRCSVFNQVASRSTKDVVKLGTGRVFSFSVVSSASQTDYFQIYDQRNATVLGVDFATPSFSIPIPGEISAERPSIVDYDFSAPLVLPASGIFFAISGNYQSYTSPSYITANATDYFVEICFD